MLLLSSGAMAKPILMLHNGTQPLFISSYFYVSLLAYLPLITIFLSKNVLVIILKINSLLSVRDFDQFPLPFSIK